MKRKGAFLLLATTGVAIFFALRKEGQDMKVASDLTGKRALVLGGTKGK